MNIRKKIVFALYTLLPLTQLHAQEAQPPLWGDIDYKGKPWVKNDSKPLKINHGLSNRHIALWASHGRYYDNEKGYWKWQRPDLFRTTEDLFTQTIVVPYLIPMLENAGANVFTPRERDWQRNEIIVDNDHSKSPQYLEINMRQNWGKTNRNGFALHSGCYVDGENPFSAGTARMVTATTSKRNSSEISYQPQIPESGHYAVYVSYQTLPNSVDDAQYIVYHQGVATEFRVNQRMGGGTWTYLGTFEFDKGCNNDNRVVLTNNSKRKGVVTADAVRFGGGMGNIQRGGTTSGLPRALEGARYYAQWAGTPYKYYSTKNGQNDYGDDINVRSLMTNWVAGGSVYVPSKEGLGVPIELSLAVHSDAGVNNTGIVGSLAIATTDFNDRKLNSGVSRQVSYDFAKALLEGLTRDIKYKYQRWNKRYLWDRNYSETRLPEVPSAIIETMSHENFNDMKYGQDPNFRFTVARSLYKTILRYVNGMHDDKFVVQPLAPSHFSIELKNKNKAKLTWRATEDPQERSAKANAYMVYTAMGDGGFDNGRLVKSPQFSLKLEPGVVYNFKVTALNDGGESFPTEVLSTAYQPSATKTVLIINGFNRLSSPAIVDCDTLRNFNLDLDPGITYGRTAGWNGDLQGKFIAGNDFDYVRTHANAINASRQYNIASCSAKAIEDGQASMGDYDCTDLLLGLEKDDGHSLVKYQTFSASMQKRISDYLRAGGRMMVSGAYVGSDMRTNSGRQFLANTLKIKCESACKGIATNGVQGLGQTFDYYKTLNEQHYAATTTDIIDAIAPAYSAMVYGNGASACVAYDGNDYKTLTMAIPFETIIDEKMRATLMKGILNYLMK